MKPKWVYNFDIKIPCSPPSTDFPTDVLRLMKKNATPKQTLKLMETNKYFLPKKFLYYVITKVWIKNEEWKYRKMDYTEMKGTDIEDIPNNLWIKDDLYFCGAAPNLAALLRTKIVVCDLKYLYLTNQTISFKYFLQLISSNKIKHINLTNTKIVYDSGDEIVPWKIIFDYIPNLEWLLWENPPNFSFKELQSLFSAKMIGVKFWEISDSFDFEYFLKSFKEQSPKVHVILEFSNSISPEFVQKIQIYIDQIIEEHEKLPADIKMTYYTPLVYFPHQTKKSESELVSLTEKFQKQNPDVFQYSNY